MWAVIFGGICTHFCRELSAMMTFLHAASVDLDMPKPVLKSLATRAHDLPVSLLALGFGSTEVGKHHLSPAPGVGKNGIR
jgi:hypothetical protein